MRTSEDIGSWERIVGKIVDEWVRLRTVTQETVVDLKLLFLFFIIFSLQGTVWLVYLLGLNKT